MLQHCSHHIDVRRCYTLVHVPAQMIFVNAFPRCCVQAHAELYTGLVEGGRVEITSGLQAGELIITRGQIGLADGTRISADVR